MNSDAKVWAIADLHLSFSTPDKTMEAFGELWIDYAQKIEKHWRRCVDSNDLVLLAGDISWASTLKRGLIDLRWIDNLPGTKVMIRGNHDYWWASRSKMQQVMPKSLHFISNDAFHWKEVGIAGTRLWDSNEYNFDNFVHFQDNPRAQVFTKEKDDDHKIFERELFRLEMSLQQLNPQSLWKIAMTHFPPIGNDLRPSRVSHLLEKYGVQLCIFGHLHQLKKHFSLFGTIRGIRYILTSADYLDFTPIQILP